MKKTQFTTLAVFGALAMTASAISVNYTVAGWSQQFPGPVTPPAYAPWGPNGYPGDTVELTPFSGTLELSPGSSVKKINELLWAINYTYAGTATDPNAWSDLLFNFSALRNMTIDGGGPVSLSQNGSLEVSWENDFLSLADGSTISFVVQGYQVDVTPLGLAREGGSQFPGFPGGTPWAQPDRDVMARFDITAASEASVPDGGTTLVLLGGALTGLGALRRKFCA